jgi:hypothetical protein
MKHTYMLLKEKFLPFIIGSLSSSFHSFYLKEGSASSGPNSFRLYFDIQQSGFY